MLHFSCLVVLPLPYPRESLIELSQSPQLHPLYCKSNTIKFILTDHRHLLKKRKKGIGEVSVVHPRIGPRVTPIKYAATIKERSFLATLLIAGSMKTRVLISVLSSRPQSKHAHSCYTFAHAS